MKWQCVVCRAPLTRSKIKFCRRRCEDEYYQRHPGRKRPCMDDGASAAIRTGRILELQAQIERETRAWLKKDLISELRALQAQRT